MSDFGMQRRDGSQGGNAEFDATSQGNNRDAWNNPIKEAQNKQRNNNQNNDNNNNNDTNNNDGGIDDNLIDNIWDKIENKIDGNNQNNQNNQQQNNQQQQGEQDPQKRLNTYLEGVGLTPFVLTDEEKTAATSGDFGPVLAKVQQQIVQAHVKALAGSETMIQSAVAKAMKEAQTGATATFLGQMNLQKMNEALPYTKDKSIAPVASTVMQKFLDRKMSTEDAIKGVDAYFKNIGSRVSESSVNKNKNGNFSSGNNQRNDMDGVPEGGWLKMLSPGN